jgi:hypothetical protein
MGVVKKNPHRGESCPIDAMRISFHAGLLS